MSTYAEMERRAREAEKKLELLLTYTTRVEIKFVAYHRGGVIGSPQVSEEFEAKGEAGDVVPALCAVIERYKQSIKEDPDA